MRTNTKEVKQAMGKIRTIKDLIKIIEHPGNAYVKMDNKKFLKQERPFGGEPHIFEIVDKIPYGYVVWNRTIEDGYIPLAQVNGYDVNTETLKAIQFKDSNEVFKLSMYGEYEKLFSLLENVNGIKDMEEYYRTTKRLKV